MRRLLLLVCLVVLVDTMLYAALVPLLPAYEEQFGLGKGGAGLLVAAYALGVLVGGIPGGVAAARFGSKRATLVGLLLIAAASVAFALADGAWSLGLARVAQGLGSALSWAGALSWLVTTTPRERRGELLGTAMGAAIFGALLGPVLGAAASEAGEAAVFSGVAVATVVLAAWAARTQGAPRQPQPLRSVLPALREPRFVAGLWFMVVPALLFGTIAVLVPLRLDSAGWGALAIGSLFVVAAACEATVGPVLGRLSDRRGRLLPLRVALVASVVVSVAFALAPGEWSIAALVLVGGLAYSAFYAPGMALLADGAEHAGLAQTLAFGLMNAAWALGNALGPAAAGGLAERAGDAVPYLAAAALCAATFGVFTRARSALAA